jgi:hypothetical protein
METQDPKGTTAALKPLKLSLAPGKPHTKLSSHDPLVAYLTDSDSEDAAPGASSPTPLSTDVVCTPAKASLPPTPTSTTETHFGSRGIKRTRADRCGGDGDDEDPPTKRPVTINEGGLGFDLLFAEYVKGAIRPIYQEQKELYTALEDVRTLHNKAESKVENDLLALQTQGDEHTKKHEGQVQSIDGLAQRITTVEKGTSDVSKLREDTSKHTTKLSQLEQDVKSKATTVYLGQRMSEQNTRIDGLDERHQQTADLVQSHEAKLQKQQVGLENRMTSGTIRRLVEDTRSELDTKIQTTDVVAQQASECGKDLSLKLEEYRTEVQTNTTAGLNDLNSKITPLQTETVELRAVVTELQATSTRHDDDVLKLTELIHKDLGALEGEHNKLSGTVEGVVKKTDTMQQSFDTFLTQNKLFQTRLDTAVPKTSKDVQSLTSRVDTLEQKIAGKTGTSTSKKISLKTPGGSPITLQEMYEWQCGHKKRLVRIDEKSMEDRKAIADLETRISEQKEEISTLKEQAEADKKQLRDEFEAEKIRTNDAFRYIAALTQQMAVMSKQISSPPVETAPNRPSAESSRRQSSQAEAVLDDPIEKLNKRVNLYWTKFVENDTRTGKLRDDIWNKIKSNKTLTDAKLSTVERLTDENGTKLSTVERITNENDTRISSLQRVGNNNEHRINELREDLEFRFASAVAHNDAGFRSCRNTFENEIGRFAALTDKRIDTLENPPSTARSVLEARKERFPGRPEKTDAVPKPLVDRVAALETDHKLTQLAMESYSASAQALNERMSNSETSQEATTQAEHAVSAKFDTLETRMTDLEAAYSAIPLPPTVPTSSVSKDEFNTFCRKFEDQKMKYEDAIVAVKNFERNKCKERITAVETKLKEIGDAKSSIAAAQAAYITSEQIDSAVEGLKATLETQIESCKSALEKAIGKQQCYEWIEGVRQKHDHLVNAHNQVSCRPITTFSRTQKITRSQLFQRVDAMSSPTQAPPHSAYPSPPPHHAPGPSPTQARFQGAAPLASTFAPNNPASWKTLPPDGRMASAPHSQQYLPHSAHGVMRSPNNNSQLQHQQQYQPPYQGPQQFHHSPQQSSMHRRTPSGAQMQSHSHITDLTEDVDEVGL